MNPWCVPAQRDVCQTFFSLPLLRTFSPGRVWQTPTPSTPAHMHTQTLLADTHTLHHFFSLCVPFSLSLIFPPFHGLFFFFVLSLWGNKIDKRANRGKRNGGRDRERLEWFWIFIHAHRPSGEPLLSVTQRCLVFGIKVSPMPCTVSSSLWTWGFH